MRRAFLPLLVVSFCLTLTACFRVEERNGALVSVFDSFDNLLDTTRTKPNGFALANRDAQFPLSGFCYASLTGGVSGNVNMVAPETFHTLAPCNWFVNDLNQENPDLIGQVNPLFMEQYGIRSQGKNIGLAFDRLSTSIYRQTNSLLNQPDTLHCILDYTTHSLFGRRYDASGDGMVSYLESQLIPFGARKAVRSGQVATAVGDAVGMCTDSNSVSVSIEKTCIDHDQDSHGADSLSVIDILLAAASAGLLSGQTLEFTLDYGAPLPVTVEVELSDDDAAFKILDLFVRLPINAYGPYLVKITQVKILDTGKILSISGNPSMEVNVGAEETNKGECTPD